MQRGEDEILHLYLLFKKYTNQQKKLERFLYLL